VFNCYPPKTSLYSVSCLNRCTALLYFRSCVQRSLPGASGLWGATAPVCRLCLCDTG
jgi:hypothetical protein